MHPPLWHPPIELSASEQVIVSRIRRAKLFIFLRQIRHRLFDEQVQSELAQIYTDSPKGNPPVPPAQLALATILQAYMGASDDEAIESLLMDRRWQLVLDCLDCEKAPFGKGTLVRFRAALIKRRLDRRLIERTVELARETKGFGHRNLRAALDSSPLWGAAKVVVADGLHQLRRGVAKDRRISIEDPTMRHGRKSHSQKFNGYKRHVLTDLDSGMVRAVGLTPANVPEAWVSDAISADLKVQQVKLVELHIDRAYLSAKLVRQRQQELNIYCKAWPVRNRGGRFTKSAFVLDWQQRTLTCPNQISMPLQLGKTVSFPPSDCAVCSLRERCTTNRRGRSVKIHPDEPLLQELRLSKSLLCQLIWSC